jgi:exodeoxyribonuclease VII small subunit
MRYFVALCSGVLMTATPEVNPPQNFEAALKELESIVARMESGDLPLEDSLAAYRRGTELLHYCQGMLESVEQQVRVLEGDTLQKFRSVDERS